MVHWGFNWWHSISKYVCLKNVVIIAIDLNRKNKAESDASWPSCIDDIILIKVIGCKENITRTVSNFSWSTKISYQKRILTTIFNSLGFNSKSLANLENLRKFNSVIFLKLMFKANLEPLGALNIIPCSSRKSIYWDSNQV